MHDFQTGSLLASFKQTCSYTHSTAVVQTKDGRGGFVLAAQPDKSILNTYHFQKVRGGGHEIFISNTLLTYNTAGSNSVEDGTAREALLCGRR